MRTRRAARANAEDTANNSANLARDENSAPQTRTRRARKADTARAENASLKRSQRVAKPLGDVTNNLRSAQSRPARKTNDKTIACVEDEITPALPRRSTRRGIRTQPLPASTDGTFEAIASRADAQSLAAVTESSEDEIQPNLPMDTSVPFDRAANSSSDEIRPNVIMEKRSGLPVHSESSGEIQPEPLQGDKSSSPNKRNADLAEESSSCEIRPNFIRQRRSAMSTHSESSDEIQPAILQNKTPSVTLNDRNVVTDASPPLRDLSPLPSIDPIKGSNERLDWWVNENKDPNPIAFDAKRPRQAVHTYGKRRRVARVSLPTMQALGVRAKSPSNGSQSDGEEGSDENLSDGSDGSDSEEDNPEKLKVDPKLQAFLAEQKKLWQEVDETELLVESD